MRVKIIDLGELRTADALPGYAAIYSPREVEPHLLSPLVMRWSDSIYLSRLDTCKAFWLGQKNKLGLKLGEFFGQLLTQHYDQEYVAVFGNHPWQCLLYLNYQREQAARGMFLLQSPLDQNIYKRIPWSSWFALHQRLIEILCALKPKGFREQTFISRQAQLKRFIDRIGVATPWQMRAARAGSMTRRFGSWLGRIWHWTYCTDANLDGFPWVAYAPRAMPQVKRELEYPLNDWAYIEVLLREDFTRLCQQSGQPDCSHINRMTWRITLFNYRQMDVELSFRHPYSLHRDQPNFATALFQAKYVYDDLMRRLKSRETDLDLPEHMPFLAWQVEINERIALTPALWDLFDGISEQVDLQQVMTLQNKLPLAFECYQAAASFFPEQSFQSTIIGAEVTSRGEHYPWSCSANNKPLFYYPDALPIDPAGNLRKVFLERASTEWWLSEDSLQTIRDYFILQDPRGRRSWAYRDAQGSWFKQGEYV